MIEILEYTFVQNAIIGAFFTSIICGIIGTIAVTNRMVFIAGGIAHSVYGGVGIAAFFGLPIMLGSTIFSILCAIILAYMLLYGKERLDSLVGSLWAFGMALGIILVELTPGYNKDFMELLLHYMRTKIDLTDFNPERLIRQINNNTQTTYNEQLERQYLDLNNVDKYVVDNHERFVKGICLEQIHIDGYKSTGIARKLNAICNVKRTTPKHVGEIFGDDFIPSSHRIRVYTLKPKEQIPDLYKIIENMEHQK